MSFFGLGIFEIVVIGVLALIFIGPERLPGVIRQLMTAYRQIRSLGTEWREQVEKEIGSDLRSLTQDMNQGLEAFGRSIEREVQEIDQEIKEAQATAETPLPPRDPNLPPLLPPASPGDTAASDDDGQRKPLDYRPGGS